MEIEGVKIYTSKEVAKSTKNRILNEGKGQTGLLCRWGGINRILLKYWRPGSYVLAGNSGTGKSYFIRLLLDDFSLLKDVIYKGKTILQSINTDYVYKDKIKFIHFGYEMKPSDEQLRSLSSLTKTSYSYIMRCEYDDVKNIYNSLTDEEIAKYNLIIDLIIANQDILYITTPLTVELFKIVVINLHNMYKNHRFVITYDNALLTKSNPNETGNDMLKLASSLGNTCRDLAKKYYDTIIILNQMNSNIQDLSRSKYPAKHYPEVNDGYGGNALYYAVDNYIFLNKPCSYGIEEYGVNKYKTRVEVTDEIYSKHPKLFVKNDVGKIFDVLHFYPHKGRFRSGNIDTFLLNALHRGTFISCPIDLIKK
jgi:hypothetical protein